MIYHNYTNVQTKTHGNRRKFMNVTFKQTGIYSPSQIMTNQQKPLNKADSDKSENKEKNFKRTWISTPKKKQDLSN